MPNTIQTQVIVDGIRDTIIKIYILGDGSPDEVNTVIFDASAYRTQSTDNKLREICYQLNGFEATLYWGATANVPIITLEQDIQEEVDYFPLGGGLVNNATTGRTGDILITTKGLDDGDDGYIILYLNQR